MKLKHHQKICGNKWSSYLSFSNTHSCSFWNGSVWFELAESAPERVVLLQLLSIHDGAVGVTNLGVTLLWYGLRHQLLAAHLSGKNLCLFLLCFPILYRSDHSHTKWHGFRTWCRSRCPWSGDKLQTCVECRIWQGCYARCLNHHQCPLARQDWCVSTCGPHGVQPPSGSDRVSPSPLQHLA